MKKKQFINIIIFGFLLFLINCFVTHPNLYSQLIKKNGGSVYSFYGIGDINYSVSGRTDAMGIMGIGLLGNYTNSINPATWTSIPTTKFTTDFNLNNIRATDGLTNAKRTYADFEGFNFTVPFNRNYGWVFNAGLHTFSVVSYDIVDNGSSLGDSYSHIYSGDGGLYKISLGMSYIIFHDLSIGAQFNYVLGTISEENRITWNNSTLFNTDNTITNSLAGDYFNFGLVYHGFSKLFKSKSLENLNIGALFSTPMKLNSNITGRYDMITGADSVSISDGKVNLPLAFGFGISNEFRNNFVAAADIYYQNWANYKDYDIHPVEFKNNIIIGAGFEWTPSRRIEESFFTRASYRVGANYNTGYLNINGQAVKSFGVGLGISLPLSKFNALDLNFSYKRRGTTASGLVLENFYNLGVTVDIGELWFIKSPGE